MFKSSRIFCTFLAFSFKRYTFQSHQPFLKKTLIIFLVLKSWKNFNSSGKTAKINFYKSTRTVIRLTSYSTFDPIHKIKNRNKIPKLIHIYREIPLDHFAIFLISLKKRNLVWKKITKTTASGKWNKMWIDSRRNRKEAKRKVCF